MRAMSEPFQDELIDRGVIEPVSSAEHMGFLDCELATFAEHRLGEIADPLTLTPAQREDWRRRALAAPLVDLAHRGRQRAFWLREGPRRVGTVCLGGTPDEAIGVHLASYSLFPEHRGRGLATRCFAAIREALAAHGHGVRLDTAWTWRPAVSFWLRQGLWLHHWRRDLSLVAMPDLPPPAVHLGPRVATLSVAGPDGPLVAVCAWRRAGRLVQRRVSSPALEDKSSPLHFVGWNGTSTLALHLALAGWPLIRSAAAQVRFRASDAVAPEGLAERIGGWEAWARHRGWRVP